MTGFFAAVLYVCLASSPTTCEHHTLPMKIEASACGLHKRALVDVGRGDEPAVARIECSH